MNISKDTQTTIAGVVGAIALLAQWILSTFFMYNLDMGADVLNAIAILAGMFVAWKVGKPGNTTTTTLVLLLLLLLPIAYCPSPAFSQTWKPTNQVTVGWDTVTSPTGTITYKIYSRPEAGGTPTLMTTVPATQATVTFTQEGRYYLGVSTVRTVGGAEVESSTISWSSDPSVTFQAQTFGVEYIIPAPAPVGLRPLN
jgi:hypothetical protein